MKRTVVIALIVVSMVFGVVAYATAATTDTGTVNVSVTPNAKITLTLSTTNVNFPAIDPMTPSALIPVTVTVNSNKTWGMTKTVTNAAAMGLTTSQANVAANAGVRGTTAMTDNYQVTVPFASDGGTAINATVKYDVTQ
jgi:membrane-associated HD superfamily phosphohydrolase